MPANLEDQRLADNNHEAAGRWRKRVLRTVWCTFGIALSLFSLRAVGAQRIETIAGGGPNDIPAILANLDLPASLAADDKGNVYVATREQHRVFKIDATGQLTVVAGNGTRGFRGDGGAAADATLYGPEGVAVDSAGNLFIADRVNNRIRRVDAITGMITTVVGTGVRGFSGDGGLAATASLNDPSAVELDAAGNLFISDQSNRRVRRVDAATGMISTVAGGGSSGLGDGGPATSAAVTPRGLAIDPEGNLLIGDVASDRVRRVDADTGIITTVAGGGSSLGDGGPATSASVWDPQDIGLDSAGNLFIADDSHNRVRRVDAVTGIITTVAGNGSTGSAGDGGPATSATFTEVVSVELDTMGNLFIADLTRRKVRRVDVATGIITTFAGNGTAKFSGDGFLATSASLGEPADVIADVNGNLYIADTLNNRVRRVDVATGIINTIAGNGTIEHLNSPAGVALDAAGNLFIADTRNHRIAKLNSATGAVPTIAGNGPSGFTGDGGPADRAKLNEPSAIAFDTAGNLLIADHSNRRVRRVDTVTGIITTIAGNGGSNFSGDGGPATAASLRNPVGIALDPAGNLAISETFNLRIRLVEAATQVITTFAGNGNFGFSGDGGLATNARLAGSRGLVFDAAGGLYLADSSNQRIRYVGRASGVISTVVGNGCLASLPSGPPDLGCYGGDGGTPTDASLNRPLGVDLDAAGNLLIADTGNGRIRRVQSILRPEIDIKPDSDSNPINLYLEGVIPVAILGSDEFDVFNVDETSLAFGRSDAPSAHSHDPHFEDVDGDGITDLLSHFQIEGAGIGFGDMEACVVGQTVDGVLFEGCDSIRTVPDMDGDSLEDTDETRFGTSGLNPDSDDDGFGDGVEILMMGTDAMDPSDPIVPIVRGCGHKCTRRH